MANNYTLKYRTFDQLMADVVTDFKKYKLKDLIDPQELIKVARKCSYELGLRINTTKETILEVERGKVRMPNDFYVLNFGIVVADGEYKDIIPSGTHVEERIIRPTPDDIPEYKPAPPEIIDLCGLVEKPPKPECICDYNPCKDGHCHIACNGDVWELVQTFKTRTVRYRSIYPLRILEGTEDLNGFCPGLYWESPMSATLKDGWMYTSFQHGKVYINYQGALEDEEGNLLVPDHEVLNEFYEYALKQRILENLILNDEEVNANKIQLIEARYRAARNNAMSLVNTPNFHELIEMFQMNRNIQMNRYFDMFASRPRRIRYGR